MRPYKAAGLLVVPAAVLTASVAAHPEPVAAPPFETSTLDGGVRAGDVVRGAAFPTKAGDLVGFDPTADTLVAQAAAGTELTGLDAHTGTVRWRRKLDDAGAYGTVLWSQNDLGAGSVLVNAYDRGSRAAELAALSTRTGETRWRMPLSARTQAMAAGPATLVGEPAESSSPMRWADPRDAPKTTKSPAPARKAEVDRVKATPTSWGPHAKKDAKKSPPPSPSPSTKTKTKTKAGTKPTPTATPTTTPTPTPAKTDDRTSGRARIGHTDEDAGTVPTRDAPDPGKINAVSAGDGGRLWSADLPEGCDLRAAAGDGKTTALRLACTAGDRVEDRLEIRDARTGALRSRTALDPAADDGGLGLLVRGGATLVRGARTFQLFAPDGHRLVQRTGDGCAEYCDLAVEGGVAVVAQSGAAADPTDGALEAFALTDGAERWRADRTVRALVREGGRLYAVGPAPQPVPFTAVSGVGEHGLSDPFATMLPAGAVPQRGTAMLVADNAGLAWYRIRPIEQPPGYLGGATDRPDPCAAVPRAEVAKRLGRPGGSAHRDDTTTCTFTSGSKTLRVEVLWAGTDEPSAIARYNVVKGEDIERYGTVVVATRTTG
ncbi:PQQ-binding-like beta-propeller repeat protein [Dactylosporangium vinaceum]|uniref:PQQ-binding-like beta-propeller repeat protein n=1 Tax=Dactylosporangium vinaceum TaxID=53362 RepID=A0ABV5M1W2_9ACTN|nr:PQQ-binding-like beta-propeller repeat protein [Dactylosporangium vinaceum]UAB99276.1 PQQ-binding-like beta-propeller repeat protein [Dactylosporangium vinaceum]